MQSIHEGKTIDYSQFYADCKSLTSIEIPKGVTTIQKSLFDGCESLESVIIPDTVTSICRTAFRDCSSLKSLVIPDGVTSIADYAFVGCKSLKSIEIPASVKFVFVDCNELVSIKFGGTMEQWKVFGGDIHMLDRIPAKFVKCSNGKVIYKR